MAWLMFQGTISVGTFSFLQQVDFTWVLNVNLSDSASVVNGACYLQSGQTDVTLYSGSNIQGAFSGSGVYLTNPTQTTNLSNGTFSISSTGAVSSILPENIKKIIKKIIRK